ncbi:DMT family transporter [Alteromonas sp. a30]|uniref:DMT family transporter n=1 Tax=Alteromonas sp. a30 TaxID=2730917 RepID=UPI002280B796|nr:DMT family transporter [Alteromonas sp. a30]MCY7295367.1 DMT family transporter [Alteromonas sp. a30]
MEDVKKGLISAHLGVFLLGITALFSKLIPLSSTDIVFARSVIAFIALALLLKITKKSLRLFSYKDYGIAIGLGLLMSVHWVTYFAAMQYSTVAIGMIALFTFPMITVFIEPFFEPVKLVWQDIMSAIVVLIGIVLIVPEADLGNEVTWGILLGIFSAFFYALRNILHRKHFTQYSGPHAMAMQSLVVAISLVAFASGSLTQAKPYDYFLLLLLGTLCTAAPHALVASSLTHIRAKTFSLIACIQPLYGVVFAYLVLSENPTWQTLAGGLFVLSAAIYETVNTHKLHKKSQEK